MLYCPVLGPAVLLDLFVALHLYITVGLENRCKYIHASIPVHSNKYRRFYF